ncbi:transposase [Kaistella flava (ex Peng et al. 2021)]|uniref:Transposase n=1 Tax=Kaistella flava (ex Peng et al. 2021) TaxID=2038776 RepID=A0A7M2Y4N4_9FLAO|nr:transposase [Kaistella flava (ex Peng et al. 2021)]QOW09198.1 transposase [Kaistella flava (ex Peng et al. 2021)]
MDKYKNKYRIQSARATWWNYGWAGAYFITICTKNRNHYFGGINQGEKNKMNLSNCGILADVFWHEIKNHAQNVELGAFVVMPNHIHGILILGEDSESGADSEDTGDMRDTRDIAETGHAPSVPRLGLRSQLKSNDNSQFNEDFESIKSPSRMGKNTVSSIIGSYKSAVTKNANRLGLEFAWQERFHDHIIRNDGEYQRINDYIESNINHWNEDKFR